MNVHKYITHVKNTSARWKHVIPYQKRSNTVEANQKWIIDTKEKLDRIRIINIPG